MDIGYQLGIHNLPVTFKEALALHDIIGSALGIPASNIFVSYTLNKWVIVVAVEGENQLGFKAGKLDMTTAAFRMAWNSAIVEYNRSSMKERADLLDRSKVRDAAVNIVADLVANGFKVKQAK